jgi:hypothetical protein
MIDCTKEIGRKASIFIKIGQVQPIGHFTGEVVFPEKESSQLPSLVILRHPPPGAPGWFAPVSENICSH